MASRACRALLGLRAGLVVVLALLFAPEAAGDVSKRPKPDYDGRGSPPASAGDAALWVPRIVLAPPYLVSEYVLRRPLGALVVTAERDHWANAIVNFFTFNEEHSAGLVPTAFFDFGFRPSVGFYFFFDKALVKENDWRVHASIGGTDWLAVSATDRLHLGKSSTAAFDISWVRRPDYAFYGIGPRTLEANRSRYGATTADGNLHYDLAPFQWLRFHSRVGLRNVDLRDGSYGHDPTLSHQVAQNAFLAPPDFPQGYSAGYERVEMAADSRPRRPAAQSGVRLSGQLAHGTDLEVSRSRSWLTYGGALGAFWDVTGHQRVLGLVVEAEFADPLTGGAMPFTEQVVLGGTGALAGFLPGRLVGRSGGTATLSYTWPIWMWLDARLHAAVGNVFDVHLRDLDSKLLRLSSGVGVRSTTSSDHQFELLVGLGTETFEHGAQVTSFRLAVGGTNGF